MNGTLRRMLLAAGLMALLGMVAAPASAQVFTGRIDIVVVDESGAVLPGVTVALSGTSIGEAVTDERGEARFLNLQVGPYTVDAKLAGFADYRNTAITVVTGQSVNLRVQLKVAGTEETIEVVGESPIIDTRKQTTTTNVTLDELQNIPSARDPWVVMQTVPGLIVDRVNVGGSESGQQSSFQAKGAARGQNSWNVDGIPVTDMSASGSSALYYDFDMFSEMTVTTGGADVNNPAAGVSLSMVLKSGTNTPHGSARFYYADESLQSTNLSDELKTSICPASNPDCEGNRADFFKDRGFEIGGPIWKDHLWGWGAYGKTDISNRTLINTLDKTYLTNTSLKFTGQFGQWRPNFTYFNGDKEKFGRNASATRPPDTAWNQTGPTPVYKGELSYVLANNLFLVGRYGHVGGGFALTPVGGMDTNMGVSPEGVYYGSYYEYSSDRPQDTVIMEGNWFKGTHEVKFGYSWRKAPVDSNTAFPGNKVQMYQQADYPVNGEYLGQITPDNPSSVEGGYQSAWVSDTITFNRMTLSAALRWDYSTSSAFAAVSQGVPDYTEIVPDQAGNEVKNAVTWNTLSPRVGMSYALNESRKTIMRASYAMFAGVLPPGYAGDLSALQYRYIYYLGYDTNRDGVVQKSELRFDLGNQGYGGFEPGSTELGEVYNRIDPDLSAPKTHEIIVGVDHEIVRNFAVSSSFTWRYFNNFVWQPYIGIRSPQYVQVGTLEGSDSVVGSYSTPYYKLNVPPPPGAGRERVNRDGYNQKYWGWEASATKRLSNRWMARFGFSTNSHTEYFSDPSTSVWDPTPNADNPFVDGGVVTFNDTASGKAGIYQVLPAYQLVANGFYEGPWGINFGANYVGRQGYAMPYFRSFVNTGDALLTRKSVLLVDQADDFRLPYVQTFDFRIQYALNIKVTKLTFDFDIFNLFNSSTVLRRQYDQRLTGRTGYNNVLEIMNPRIARLGVRFSF